MLIRAMCIIAAIVLLAGCGPRRANNVTPRELVGTYEVSYMPYSTVIAKERLVVKANGEFEQTFYPASGPSRKNTGTWKLSRNPHGLSLDMEGYMQYLDAWGHKVAPKPERTNVITGVFGGGSRISILINDDLDYYYRKK